MTRREGAVITDAIDSGLIIPASPVPASPAAIDPVIVCDFGSVNGGSAQVAILSALGLAERGLAVTFVYAVGPIDPRLAAAGVSVHRLPLPDIWSVRNPVTASMQGIWNRTAAALFSTFLGGFDKRRTIVHFHQWTKAFSASVMVQAANDGYRSVITSHDYFLVCPNGALYDFPAETPCSRRPLSTGCIAANCDSRSRAHKLVRLARSGAQRFAFSGLDAAPAIIHVSDFARRVAEPLLPWAARHYTITNPVLIAPCDRATAETNRDYVFVGRLVPEKGCVEFARVARRAGVAVAFVGTGPCEAAIREANPDARMLGWLPPADAAGVVRASRALVFPSKWQETSGLVCLEALANGVPVLASSRTAAGQVVRHGITGMVVDPDDIATLHAALAHLADDAVVASMSRAAFAQYWAAPPTVGRHVDDLLPVYRAQLYGTAAEPRAAVPAGVSA